MIPYTYGVYGINTTDYTAGVSPIDSAPSGTLLNDHYTLDVFYNNTDPLYSADRSKKFDESLYLWHIGAESAAGTNAAYCVEASNTLNLEVSMNKVSNVPLACQLTNVTNNRFQRTAQGRMCYDYFYSGWCDYLYSRLFVDINRTAFCARPVCQVYDKSTNQATTQSIQNVAAYINQNPNERYVYGISFEMYNSVDMPRTRQQSYIPGRYANERGVLTFDILTDRPIPSNATALKNDMLYHYSDNTPHNTYITDKCYSPFTQVSSGLWYSGTTQTFNPYYIGFRTARTVSELINGFGTATHGGKVTGAFIRYSDKIQDFDDVKYKWRTNVYYNTGAVFLDNGFPLNSLTGTDTINIFSSIEILDKKGLSDGAAIQAAVKHECAFYGFYFADTLDDAQNAVLGTASTHIYLPEMIGGITTGRYFTGDEIPLCPYANSTTVSDNAFKYNPDEAEPIDDDGLTDTIINTGTISAGVTYYAMTDTEIKDLTTWLNATYSPADETQFIQDFKGTNPGDYITTVMYYPFDVPYTGVSQPVKVGDLTAGNAQGAKLTYEYGNMYSYGSYTFPKFGDFRDYLKKLSVIIPFCGTVELDPIIWAGHELTIKMSVDFPTGVCTAYLYRTGENGAKAIIDSVSGQIGVPLPLSSFSNGSYQVAITNMLAQGAATNRQIMMSTLGAGAGVITAAVGAYTGNYKMAFGGAVAAVTSNSQANAGADKLENIAYNIDHTKPTLQSVSGGSPFINCGQDYRCVIIRCIPVFAPGYDATAYGKTTGFATCRQGKLSSISHGFTQCAGVDLDGVSATATEKAMIFNALQSGVFV